MKYLSLALLAATVAADRYQFVAESSNEEYNGKYLYAEKGSPPGNDYVYLNDEGVGLEYEDNTLEGWDLKLARLGQYVVLTSHDDGDTAVEIKDDYLELGQQLWACPAEQDPNGNERDNLVYANDTQPLDDCAELKFKAEKLDDDDDDDDSSSSVPPISLPSPSSSIPPISLPSPISPTGGWNNTFTVTLPTLSTTLTHITTYCPTETTITITTCGPHTCNPTTITVSEPTTVTVSSCLPSDHPPPDHSSVLPTSVSSWENNGAKVVPIMAGFVGFVAMLV